MRRLTKYIAAFLSLAVLANGVLASHMTILMVDNAITDTTSSSTHSSLPCHNETTDITASLTEADKADCCDGDCSGCVSGPNILAKSSVVMANTHQSIAIIAIDNHLLPAHSSSLYRPPILIST